MAMVEARALTVREAYDALAAFGREMGLQRVLLLLHVAVPQSVRADLVNLLKQNFLTAEGGSDLTIDADVLLSPLLQPAAGGYYRLDPELRRHCVALLDARYRHQPVRRSVEVAHFLLAYADALEQQAGLALDPLLSEYLAIQRWVALSFIDPAAAASAFAGAVARAAAGDGTAGAVASLRLGGVTSALSIPLEGQTELLAYARGIDALQQGAVGEAEQWLGWMSDQIVVGDVALDPGRDVLASWRGESGPSQASTTTAAAGDAATPTTATASAQSSLLINIPPAIPAERFIDRPELAEVRRALLDPTPAPSAGSPRPIVVRLVGDDGLGKWTLANRLVHDPAVIAAFPDGIIWLDESGQGYPTAALGDYARAVGMTDLLNEQAPVRIERFRELFASRRVLIVAEQRIASDVVPTLYKDCGPRCTVLHLVSGDSRTDGARVVRLKPFEGTDVTRLALQTNPLRRVLAPAWQRYAEGNPLLVKLAAGAQSVGAAVPDKPSESWRAIDTLVLAIWRAHQPEVRAQLAAVGALQPEHWTVFNRDELQKLGEGTLARLESLGFAERLADSSMVRLSRPARSAISRAQYSEPDAPVVVEDEERSSPSSNAPYVFISHSSADKEVAERIAQRVRGVGVSVRTDADPDVQNVDARLIEVINEAAAVLFLMSSNAAKSEWMRRELIIALDERQRREEFFLFPVTVDRDSREMPWAEMFPGVETIQWAHAPGGELPPDLLRSLADLVRKNWAAAGSGRASAYSADPRVRDHALVVGIGRYDALGLEVAGAVDAAQTVADWLRSPDGGGIPSEHVDTTFIRGSEGTADEKALLAKLNALDVLPADAPPLAASLPGGGRRRLYLYFGGVALPGSNRQPAFLPASGSSEQGRAIDIGGWARYFASSFEEVILWIDAVQAPQRSFERVPPPDAVAYQRRSTFFGAISLEPPGRRRSTRRFTQAIVRGLEGEASDARGRVTANGLASFIREVMTRESAAANVQQEPTFELTGEIVLVDRDTRRPPSADMS